MAREGLTGSRIRERRTMARMKQADLARRIGISASYLNLIEHNRRRIGGKLLLDIAAELGVEPSALSEGAEAALIATLREAAVEARLSEAETAQADDFAGRFPGWAETLAGARRRIAALERTVETLTDRLAHDPQLAASVHELLSTAAAIRSTASLLADSEDMEPAWRKRFHANLDQDSRRLAESSTALVGFLEAENRGGEIAGTPQEELDAFLEAHGYFFAELEPGFSTETSEQIAALIEQAPMLRSVAARHMAGDVLAQAAVDAQALPMQRLEAALGEENPDPADLAQDLSVPVPLLLRRLASVTRLEAGLIVVDRAGSLLLRKPAAGFSIPRFGNCCPLWPLFAAPAQPGMLLRTVLRPAGQSEVYFQSYAVSEARAYAGYNRVPLTQSLMLVLPMAVGDVSRVALDVGPTCRVCSRATCPGRREPSILSAGF